MSAYLYKGYRITNLGYHQPDHCVWWEAVDEKTNEASFHGHTLREVEMLINDWEWNEKVKKLENENMRLKEALQSTVSIKWHNVKGYKRSYSYPDETDLRIAIRNAKLALGMNEDYNEKCN